MHGFDRIALILLLIPLLGGLVLAGSPVAAAPVTVKLASLAPDNTIWDRVVEEMGAEWQEATDGRVRLRVYPGGVAGDEPDVLRKMRIGQLHAAVLSVGGLGDIDPAFRVFTVPFLFDSYEELYHVLQRMTPELKQRLEAKGYVLLNWGHAGWIHLFSTQPVKTVDDLRKLKFFVAAGDDGAFRWWKDQGFRPVALATTDILSGLQTGMIEAVPSTPLASLLLQWYGQVPHMMDIGFAPLVGGTVVNKRIWDRIAEADRNALLAAAQKGEKRLEREVPKQDEESVAQMQARGLKVSSVEGTAAAAAWRAVAGKYADRLRRGEVPPDVLRKVLEIRDAFRKQQGSAAGGRP
jgi:TRAP-type C4-dicarboxylate transport system substrate-binding protein